MNILFDCLELTNCLKNIKSIISDDNVNNVLSSVYVDASKDEIILQATNGSESYQEKLIKSKIKEGGIVLLKCDLLYEIVSKIHQEEVSLIKIEENIVQIKAGSLSCEINSWQETNFPRIDFDFDPVHELEFNARDLDVIFEKLIPFVNVEHTQNFISTNGILINPINNKEVECIATDTIRLVYYKFETKTPFVKFVLNPSTIKLIKMLNSQTKTNTKIYINQQKIYLKAGQVVIISNLFDADSYPNVVNVLLQPQKNFFVVQRQALIDALRLTDVFSSNNIVVNLEDKALSVKCSDQDLGNCCCKVDILDTNVSKFQFRINHKKLLELMYRMNTEQITFKFNETNSAFILSTQEQQFLYLILPLKMF